MPDMLDEIASEDKDNFTNILRESLPYDPGQPPAAPGLPQPRSELPYELVSQVEKESPLPWTLFKKGLWGGLGIIGWPFERLEYTLATYPTAALEARRKTMKERGIDRGFSVIAPRLIRSEEAKRESEEVLKALSLIGKPWIPGEPVPEGVKTFNDFFGEYYGALTGEEPAGWYKAVSGGAASVLTTPYLFGKILKGIAGAGKLTGIPQRIAARRLPAWQKLKLMAKAETGARIEKASDLGKTLGNRQIKRLAKELSTKTGRNITPNAVRLRLTQIIKGGITTRPELAAKANPIIQEAVLAADELKKLGILPEYTYVSKLPKKEVANLLSQKRKLQSQLKKLVVGKEVIPKFPGKRRIVQRLETKLLEIDEQLGKFATIAKPTRPAAKGVESLSSSRSKEFIELLKQKRELEYLGKSTKEIQKRIAGFIQPGTVHEIGHITGGTPDKISKLVTQKRNVMKRLANITEPKLVKPHFPGKADKIRQLESKIDDITGRVQISYKQGGTGYFPRLYATKEEEAAARRIPLFSAHRVRAKYAIERKDIPEAVRKAMGEIKDPRAIIKRLIQEGVDIEQAKLFQFAAQNPNWVSGTWRAGLAKKALPDTKAYGALKGKYVAPKIFDDVTELIKTKGRIEALYDAGIGYWKLGKVVFNPATHFRNMFSNSILLDLSGMDHAQQVKYFGKALSHIKKGSVEYQTAKKFFMRTTQVKAEIFDDMLRAIKGGKGDPFAVVFNGANKFAKTTAKGPAEIYQAEEFIGKFMKYLQSREQGMSVMDSVMESNKWLFDYGDLALWEKKIARRIMPFYTFPRKALPRIIEAAANRPLTLAKYPMMAKGMMQYSLYELDISEKDWASIERDLPDYMKNGNYILMPYRDQNGDLRFFDWTYVVPWGELYEANERGLLKVGVTNPIFQLVSDIRANKSGWTGRKIYDDAIPVEKQTDAYRREQNLKKMLYVWQGLVPSLAYKGIYWDKLYGAATGKKARGKDMLLPETIAHTLFGARTQAIDPQEQRVWRLLEMQDGFKELQGNMLRVLMQQNRGDITEEEFDKKWTIYIDQLQEFHADAFEEEENMPSIDELLDTMDDLIDVPLETGEEK